MPSAEGAPPTPAAPSAAAAVYLTEVERALPRLLAGFDTDPTSPTFGLGDRFRWAWKLIDFGNGTFQGAAYGLAQLLAAGLLPELLPETAALRRLDACFTGAAALTRSNGSLEEAFPYESSFCVTALVAHDLLAAVQLLDGRIDAARRARWLAVVAPLARFLQRSDETHGFISNHLATAAAALFRWSDTTGQPGDARGGELLDRILQAQSPEGWFREYDGADPGYQTLCTHYLAELHALRPDLGLAEPLARSVRFLQHFAHPDGSFGGLYGSRSTRFYYPSGLERLAPEVPEAAALAARMRRSIAAMHTVTLASMDPQNLVPMFNSYCVAASLAAARGEAAAGPPAGGEAPALPCDGPPLRRRFDHAGLLVDRGPRHYTVVSWHKGGVVSHFREGARALIDAGVCAVGADGVAVSTQAYAADNPVTVDGDTLTVTAPLTALKRALPSPLQLVALRLLNLTVMRQPALGDRVKRGLVRLLITGKRPTGATNVRTVHLGEALAVADVLHGDPPPRRLPLHAPFLAIHMASAGYWQRQDDADAGAADTRP